MYRVRGPRRFRVLSRLTLSGDSAHNGAMTNDTTTPTDPTVTVPGITRIIGRNVADLAAMLRNIEPEEMNRADLLSLLGIIAASAELSAALLDDLADRMNADAVKAADIRHIGRMIR